MTLEICVTCKHWHGPRDKTIRLTPLGSCRRHAPKERDGGLLWPSTLDTQWCGDWTSRRDAAPAAAAHIHNVYTVDHGRNRVTCECGASRPYLATDAPWAEPTMAKEPNKMNDQIKPKPTTEHPDTPYAYTAQYAATFPRYRCHKIVRAAQIYRVSYHFNGNKPECASVWVDVNGQSKAIPVPIEWIERHTPQVDGYLVMYEDGYLSYSPKKAFEDGYAPLEPSLANSEKSPFGFGLAIVALKAGKRVSRAGWNGKGMWLALVKPDANRDTAPTEWLTGSWYLAPWIGMNTADNGFVPWLASQTDILAEDWMVVP